MEELLDGRAHFDGGLIFGYDTGQISGFLEMNSFLECFGQRKADGAPYFSTVRSGLIVALLSIGTLIGALVAAPVADRIGRRLSVSVWSAVVAVGFVIQIASSTAWYQVMIGRFIAGLGVGALSLLVPMYQGKTSSSYTSKVSSKVTIEKPRLLHRGSEAPSSRHISYSSLSASFWQRASISVPTSISVKVLPAGESLSALVGRSLLCWASASCSSPRRLAMRIVGEELTKPARP